MGNFDGYLICADCDGTMVDSKGKLSERNAAAIRHFQEEGGLFTLATGRFPKHVREFEDSFMPNTYQIMGNGTTLYDVFRDEVIWEMTLTPPREVLRFVEENDLCRLIYVDHLRHSQCWCREDAGEYNLFRAEGTQKMEDLFMPDPEAWHKINFCFHDPEMTVKAQRLLQEQFGTEYTFVRSWSTGVELLPLGGGKGQAALRLKSMLGDKVKKLVCIGDYENDVSMLEVADIGYAVANATELCLQVADRITVHHNEDAMAVMIAELEQEAKQEKR